MRRRRNGSTPAAASAPASSAPLSAAIAARRLALSLSAVNRPGFVGAMFRPGGSPPYGIFSPNSSNVAPQPYPTPGTVMTGPSGYCEQTAANGASIDGSYVVDPTKLSDLIYLGARWTRMPVPQFNVDVSHIYGAGQYAWAPLDAAQCISLTYHNIKPVIGIEPGPVYYDATPGTFSPTVLPAYPNASDFGGWCGAVAAHEAAVFPAVTQYSIPASEANDPNAQLFPGGEAQIAAFTKSCYAAIKAANPKAFVYAFELNMDGQAGATQFVSDMAALGCRPGTCYDGITMHFTLRYPIPPPGTPCYPNPGGDYSMQCITDIRTASGSPNLHILISETVYLVPSTVPDEQTKADAVVQAFSTLSADPNIDRVRVRQRRGGCALYSDYFAGGCLIDASGNQLPGVRCAAVASDPALSLVVFSSLWRRVL